MNAHKKNVLVNGIRTYTPPLNAVLLTILISVVGYWGNQVTAAMKEYSHHFDILDSKVATTQQQVEGNRINIVTLLIDDGNTKTDIATIKAVTPYFNK